MHETQSPLAGQLVTLCAGTVPVTRYIDGSSIILSESLFRIVDWYDYYFAKKWSESTDYTALEYNARRREANLPDDDSVLYGMVGGHRCLVHLTEIEDI